MRLVSFHIDTVRALEQLHIPFDDLTPEGLWGSPYHLIGLAPEQSAVLEAWNLEIDDITPKPLLSSDAASKKAWPTQTQQRQRDNGRDLSRSNGRDPAPVSSEPKKHGDPIGAAAERELVGQAAVAAENGSPSGQATPTKLRVSVGGKYREAAVQRGKILLDGQSFDSPAQATKAVSAAKGDWVFWEYYDNEAGKWRMLDRDWQPSAAS